MPALREPDFDQFCAALTVMLQDAFGTNCLQSKDGAIDPKSETVELKVDESTVEIRLKDMVSWIREPKLVSFFPFLSPCPIILFCFF